MCCTTRGVHLEIVPDLNATTSIRSFKRFSSQRGIPSLIVSDNSKTFKSGAKIILKVVSDQVVKEHFANLQVSWKFKMEKGRTHVGGFFWKTNWLCKTLLEENYWKGQPYLWWAADLFLPRLKPSWTRGRSPLFDFEELLTSTHLILGYWVWFLPDPFLPDDHDPDYNLTRACASKSMRYVMTTF